MVFSCSIVYIKSKEKMALVVECHYCLKCYFNVDTADTQPTFCSRVKGKKVNQALNQNEIKQYNSIQ